MPVTSVRKFIAEAGAGGAKTFLVVAKFCRIEMECAGLDGHGRSMSMGREERSKSMRLGYLRSPAFRLYLANGPEAPSRKCFLELTRIDMSVIESND